MLQMPRHHSAGPGRCGTIKMKKKSNDILEAIDAGQSCEQILANDRTVTYHDIFHALTEAPTSHWRKNLTESTGRQPPGNTAFTRRTPKHRRD